jgi:hypothetical protein
MKRYTRQQPVKILLAFDQTIRCLFSVKPDKTKATGDAMPIRSKRDYYIGCTQGLGFGLLASALLQIQFGPTMVIPVLLFTAIGLMLFSAFLRATQ